MIIQLKQGLFHQLRMTSKQNVPSSKRSNQTRWDLQQPRQYKNDEVCQIIGCKFLPIHFHVTQTITKHEVRADGGAYFFVTSSSQQEPAGWIIESKLDANMVEAYWVCIF